ncbi:MAG: biopolymer transporter ExbD [Pseudomonadota bacterium]
MRRMATRPGAIFAKRRQRESDDERILPLINIVFLLLIFFMVVGRLSAADPFEIVPPRSASEGQPANEPLLIAIGAEGQLALNGALISEEALLARIAGDQTSNEVRLKSDGRVAAARVVALIEALRGIGVASVRLMTVPTKPAGRSARGPGATE